MDRSIDEMRTRLTREKMEVLAERDKLRADLAAAKEREGRLRELVDKAITELCNWYEVAGPEYPTDAEFIGLAEYLEKGLKSVPN